MSRYRRFGWTLPRITEQYCTVNRTALLQLYTFGGCAISYEELTDQEETDWVEPLGELTGLTSKTMLDCRDQILRDPRHDDIDETLDPQAEKLYNRLSDLKGKLLEPSIRSRES